MFKWILKKIRKDNKGFTLVELVVVIAILGILAAIAVPRLGKSRTSAAVTAHNANVRTLESAANMYIADKGKPEGTENNKTGTIAKDDLKEYLQEWPEIPKGLIGLDVVYDKKGDNEELVTGTIAAGTEYTVTVDTEGTITVTPGKIKEVKAKTD